jgi:hypothetical protein
MRQPDHAHLPRLGGVALAGGPARASGLLASRITLTSGALATLVALALVYLVPRGGDASAHLYRTFLVERGSLVWDNLWFAGQYPLVSYSLLYYLPAALLGNNALAAIGVVASAVLFARLLWARWGAVARLPAYSFAVLAGGQFFTGDYPYTLGFTALLATLVALQHKRRWLGVACAAVTLGCSPLAFLFLCLALAALFLRPSRDRWREALVAVPLAGLAAIEAGALSLFPSPHLIYPFAVWRLVLGVPVGLLGLALSLRARSGRPLASIFAIWTVATVAGFLIPSPVGHNLLRPSTLVFPLMLLAALLADFRPRWLAIPAVAVAFAANVGPYVATGVARTDPAAKPAFWSPLLSYAAAHGSSDYRLEVVPTINHWEAYYVPRSGFAIARGWYQQLDTGYNPSLYRRPLTPAAYRTWLRSVGVEYVILANTPPAAEAAAERRLLLSGRSGLERVFAAPSGTVYELRDATPLLTGVGPARIEFIGHTSIGGWVARPGTYLLRVHYTPYWVRGSGSLCLQRGPGGMTALHVRRAGSFSFRAPKGVESALAVVFDPDDRPSATCHA